MKIRVVAVSVFAVLAGASAFAAATVVDSDATNIVLEENTEYELSGDTTGVTQFTVNEGAKLDLKGKNFTLAGKLVSNGKTLVTNSVDDTMATLKLDCSSMNQTGNRFGAQMQNITLGGNLKLHLNAVASGDDRQKTFQGVENTHTGGTVLEGFVSDNSSQPPLVNTTNAFGTGILTLKNGTRIRYNGSDGVMPWSGLASENGDSGVAVTNEIYYTGTSNGYALSVTGAVSVAENATLYLNLYQAQWRGHRLSGPFAGIKGTLLVSCSRDNENFYLGNPDDMAYGTLALKSGAHVRIDRGGSFTYKIGALESAADVTAADNAYIYNTQNGTITLEVGGLGKNTVFYGRLQNDTGDLKLDKVGDGTLRLGGVNSYKKETIVSGGTLELVGAGTLGDAETAANICFAGGTLAFGDGDEVPDTTDYSARIKNSTAPVSVDTKSNNIAWETVLDASNTAGLVKKGSGTLTLSAGAGYSGATRIEAGALVVGGAFDPSQTTIVADDLAAAAEADFILAAKSFTNDNKPVLETADTALNQTRYRLVKKQVDIDGVAYDAYGVEKKKGLLVYIR